ncbi:MAG: large conductance mechanosensitive channel protein MscL [Chloroflexota bacterium]|nr:MAG: large conductance mechanosensitive channel protein MscL [Chloroflexota bacterium]
MSGFRAFLLRGNVVELAVAVVVGAAFGNVVTALVTGFLTPLIGVFGGIPDFAAWTFAINGSVFKPGLLVNALIAFVVLAAVIYYLVVVPANAIAVRALRSAAPAAPTTRPCPECLSDIPLAARRCAHCASVVAGER